MSDPTKSHKQRPTSQESKVTSTPKRKFSSEYSPSVSSIHYDSVNEHLDGSSSSLDITYVNPNQINTDSSDSASVDELAVVDSLEDVLKSARFKKTGNYWRTMKPIRDDTLYCLLLTKPSHSEDIALEFLEKFKTKTRFCVNLLLKLFIDVSGYQKLEIENVYNFSTCNAQEAIDLLTAQLPDQIYIETNSFLLDDNQTKASTVIKNSLYLFLETLIVNGHTEKVLYNSTFVVHVFNFIRWMAFSTLRPIRATGIIFSLKFLTGCCKVYYQINRKIDTLMQEGQQESSVMLNTTLQKVIDYMELFSGIFFKNCLIPDKKCYYIRKECAKEIAHWFKYCPKYIFKETKCIAILLKFMHDESQKVRLSTIETFEKMLSSIEYVPYLKPKMEVIAHIIGKRVYDVNLTVSAKACDIYSLLVKYYPTFIKPDRIKSILQLIYHENHQLANSAAKFVVNFLRKNNSSSNSKGILIHIANTNCLPDFQNHSNLLVETLIEHVPELKSWEDIIQLVKDDGVDLQCRKSLLGIFYETVSLLLSKRPYLRKTNVSISVANNDVNEIVAFECIPQAKALLEKYNDNDECVILICEIVLLINSNELRSNYSQYYFNIVEQSLKIFQTSKNTSLMDVTIKVSLKFCQDIGAYKNRCLLLVESVALDLKNKYYAAKSQWMQEKTGIGANNIYYLTLQLSKLFEFFDITSLFSLEDVFIFDSNVSDETTNNYVVLSRHYLTWLLKKSINMSTRRVDPEEQELIETLSSKCEEYLTITMNILENHKNASLRLTVFENICTLIYDFRKLVEHPSKVNIYFKPLLLSVDEDKCHTLMKFLENEVIENEQLILKKRFMLLKLAMQLLYIKVFPEECFQYLFYFYASNYQNYKALFDNMISQIRKIKGGLISNIMYTLVKMYENVLFKCNQINPNGEDFNKARLLAKKLSGLKKNISKDEQLTMVNMGFFYAFRKKENYLFLNMLKYFAEDLPEHTNLQNIFKSLIPKGDEKDDTILYFSMIFKDKKSI